MKRHSEDSSEHIQKKIRKLEKKLKKQKEKLNVTRGSSVLSDDETAPQEDTPTNTTPQLPAPEPQIITIDEDQPSCSYIEPGAPTLDEVLPEEFLLALGEEGKLSEEKGQNINQQIAERWTNIIKLGIKKDNLQTLLNKYPSPANFPMAIAPKLNPEIVTAVSENVLKRDKKFEYKQNLTGKVLSCLGMMITDIMKGNLNSLKMIEGVNDAAKILCNMNHYDSITRRHFILTSVQSCVKQAITDVPADTYLFGENLNERVKTAKAIERSATAMKQPQTFKKQNIKNNQPSTSKNLNWKSPSRRPPLKENNYRGGPKNQHQTKKTYNNKQQQSKPARRR